MLKCNRVRAGGLPRPTIPKSDLVCTTNLIVNCMPATYYVELQYVHVIAANNKRIVANTFVAPTILKLIAFSPQAS